MNYIKGVATCNAAMNFGIVKVFFTVVSRRTAALMVWKGVDWKWPVFQYSHNIAITGTDYMLIGYQPDTGYHIAVKVKVGVHGIGKEGG